MSLIPRDFSLSIVAFGMDSPSNKIDFIATGFVYSQLAGQDESGGMSVADCARRIIEVAARFGLRLVEAPQAPEPITEDDLGVVCYQVVLPL